MIIIAYYLLASAAGFALYGIDKMLAKAARSRIPERTLLLSGLAGGSFGALLGMIVFHHKTRKQKFWLLNAAFSALHLSILCASVYIGR
jgi:uncharacterized protein